MSNEFFLAEAKHLASEGIEQYATKRRDIVTARIQNLEPSGDAEFDGLQRQVFEAELLQWERAIRLTFYCRRKLEK